jgi:hypothetical protein
VHSHVELRHCGAVLREGGRCQRVAGAGTDHSGWGRCSRHGGKTRKGRQQAAVEEALETQRLLYGEPLWEDPQKDNPVDWLRHADFVAIRQIYKEERDRLLRVAQVCLDIGMAERRLALAEQVANTFQQALLSAAEDIGLTAEQKAALPGAVRQRLELVPAEAA